MSILAITLLSTLIASKASAYHMEAYTPWEDTTHMLPGETANYWLEVKSDDPSMSLLVIEIAENDDIFSLSHSATGIKTDSLELFAGKDFPAVKIWAELSIPTTDYLQSYAFVLNFYERRQDALYLIREDFSRTVIVDAPPYVAPVPEPSTFLLLGSGLLGLGWYGRKRKKT